MIKFFSQVKSWKIRTSIGHSLVIVIPKKEREREHIVEGDWIQVTIRKVPENDLEVEITKEGIEFLEDY